MPGCPPPRALAPRWPTCTPPGLPSCWGQGLCPQLCNVHRGLPLGGVPGQGLNLAQGPISPSPPYSPRNQSKPQSLGAQRGPSRCRSRTAWVQGAGRL